MSLSGRLDVWDKTLEREMKKITFKWPKKSNFFEFIQLFSRQAFSQFFDSFEKEREVKTENIRNENWLMFSSWIGEFDLSSVRWIKLFFFTFIASNKYLSFFPSKKFPTFDIKKKMPKILKIWGIQRLALNKLSSTLPECFFLNFQEPKLIGEFLCKWQFSKDLILLHSLWFYKKKLRKLFRVFFSKIGGLKLNQS